MNFLHSYTQCAYPFLSPHCKFERSRHRIQGQTTDQWELPNSHFRFRNVLQAALDPLLGPAVLGHPNKHGSNNKLVTYKKVKRIICQKFGIADIYSHQEIALWSALIARQDSIISVPKDGGDRYVSRWLECDLDFSPWLDISPDYVTHRL